jgi:hypothetical protein
MADKNEFEDLGFSQLRLEEGFSQMPSVVQGANGGNITGRQNT